MKRCVCVIIALVVMLTLSVSIFGLDNIETGNIYIYGIDTEISTVNYFENPIVLPYGQLHLIHVDYNSDGSNEDKLILTGSFNITISDNVDLYFAYNATNTSNLSYDVYPQSTIGDYRDSSKDFTSNNMLMSSAYDIEFDEYYEDLIVSEAEISDSTYVVSYKCYSNVPAGTYSIEYSYTCVPASTSFSGDFILGLYAVDTSPDDPDFPDDEEKSIIDKFKDGTYTFEQALEEFIENMKTVLDDMFSTTEYKNFYVNYTSAMIEILEKESDIIYNSTVSDFNDQGEEIVDEYEASDEVDPTEYINRLQMLFTDALSQAVSPEQGTFLSSVFQNLLAKLQLAFDMAYKQELDDEVSDVELSMNFLKKNIVKDAFDEESRVRELFKQSQYESFIEFDTWFNSIGDYTNYRNIFNFLFNETGPFKLFLTVPFALVLVSLALGTTTSILRGRYYDHRSDMRYERRVSERRQARVRRR